MNYREQDEQLLTRVAVAQARVAILGTGATSPNHTAPAQINTAQDPTTGQVIHVALYNVDSYNDPSAIYHNSKA